MQDTIGLPATVLADTGYASRAAPAALQQHGVEPLVAIGRMQPHRPCDFRPPPAPKTPQRITEPWRIEMKAKLESDDGRSRYKMRKQTVEPAFGIIKSVIGFTRLRLRGLSNAATEWILVTLAYNCRRIARMQACIREAPPRIASRFIGGELRPVHGVLLLRDQGSVPDSERDKREQYHLHYRSDRGDPRRLVLLRVPLKAGPARALRAGRPITPS